MGLWGQATTRLDPQHEGLVVCGAQEVGRVELVAVDAVDDGLGDPLICSFKPPSMEGVVGVSKGEEVSDVVELVVMAPQPAFDVTEPFGEGVGVEVGGHCLDGGGRPSLDGARAVTRGGCGGRGRRGELARVGVGVVGVLVGVGGSGATSLLLSFSRSNQLLLALLQLQKPSLGLGSKQTMWQ